MVAFASVVVHNVKYHPDTGLMKSLHHVSKFQVLLVVVSSARVLRMRREEVQRHVAPVVALLGVALINRHELDNRYSEFFQIGDLFHQAGICAGTRRIQAGVRILRETPHVKLVDNCIGLMMGSRVSCPVERRTATC